MEDHAGINLKALVVDDDEIGRKELARLLTRHGVRCVDETATAAQALSLLMERTYDVVFLDIQMPGLTGMEAIRVINRMPSPPSVVFVTAYPHYAVEAFEEAAFDYLLKPVSEERLVRTLERIARRQEVEAPSPTDRLPIEVGDRVILLDVSEIRYAVARDDYAYVATYDATYRTSYTLGELHRRLGPSRFLRVHRSFLVNIDHILEIHPYFKGTLILRMDDKGRTEIPVSRREAPRFRMLLGW
jgi:DNA-binding LytR/AlgR family response regulator